MTNAFRRHLSMYGMPEMMHKPSPRHLAKPFPIAGKRAGLKPARAEPDPKEPSMRRSGDLETAIKAAINRSHGSRRSLSIPLPVPGADPVAAASPAARTGEPDVADMPSD